MKRLLQNQRFITAVMLIVALVAGMEVGSFWIDPPNGRAVDAETLAPGKYLISYPEPEGVGTVMLDITHDANKFIALVYDDSGPLLIALPEKNLKMRIIDDKESMPYLIVENLGNKKRFTVRHPNAKLVEAYDAPENK